MTKFNKDVVAMCDDDDEEEDDEMDEEAAKDLKNFIADPEEVKNALNIDYRNKWRFITV